MSSVLFVDLDFEDWRMLLATAGPLNQSTIQQRRARPPASLPITGNSAVRQDLPDLIARPRYPLFNIPVFDEPRSRAAWRESPLAGRSGRRLTDGACKHEIEKGGHSY